MQRPFKTILKFYPAIEKGIIGYQYGVKEECKLPDASIRGVGLKFSSEVIETIAGIAASEIPGIVGMSGGVVEGFAEKLGRKNLAKGVSVELGEQEVAIDLKVIVEYGKNIPEIYQQVVKAVKAAVQHMTGLTVVEVNMYVEGVTLQSDEFEEESTEPSRTIR